MRSHPLEVGDLSAFDDAGKGDPRLAAVLQNYVEVSNLSKTTRSWARAMQWIENFLFSAGRHYQDDLMMHRLARGAADPGDSQGSSIRLSIINQAASAIPRPVNDILGRYVESNVALLTENRPVPRATAKSDEIEDQDAAELSQLTLEYMWNRLSLPEKHREIARLILHCGVAWMEVWFDPTQPRYIKTPVTEDAPKQIQPVAGAPSIQTKVSGPVTKFDEFGRPLFEDLLNFGDVTANVISPFEMCFPTVHRWGDDRMNWVMRQRIVSVSAIKDRLKHPDLQKQMGRRRKGWYFDRVDNIKGMPTLFNLPLWWWERIADIVEGSGPSLFLGAPSDTNNLTIERIFDRKPCAAWPKGRTVITYGDQVIYDSPREIGARAYSTRFPDRWHPYTYFAWDKLPGTPWARALVTRLLPKLKRINSIDTTCIMWRRHTPMAAWITPKSTAFLHNSVTGRTGQIVEYDPRRTAGNEPKMIYPPPYPEAALREREMQLQEMEMIAGTEEILRGQRPQGVNSAQMIAILRRQVLASRSGILQAWDESLESEGSAILQEVVKNIQDDQNYLEALRMLAREKNSRMTIKTFSGKDLSDNVIVRIDTASEAFISREARQAQAIEFLQYAASLSSLPPGLRQNLIEELGFSKSLTPQGPDVDRAKRLISWIKQRQFQFIVPMPEDDPAIILEFLVQTKKSDPYWDFDATQAKWLDWLISVYQGIIQQRQAMMMQQQMALLNARNGGNKPQGNTPDAGKSNPTQ